MAAHCLLLLLGRCSCAAACLPPTFMVQLQHTRLPARLALQLADNAVTIIGGSPSPSSPALDAPPSSPTPDETGGEAIWGSFTYNANSFFQGPKFISSTQVGAFNSTRVMFSPKTFFTGTVYV